MSDTASPAQPVPAPVPADTMVVPAEPTRQAVVEKRPALDPTRYGDWEKNGRCIDF
ncbi:MAG TPA: DUF1674 domain-containing protein [Rhodanobacter sp.]|nr:DUF1674 domain-containing protein [Rhodanobacter sp.]